MADGLIFERRFEQMVMNEVVRRIDHLAELREDDLLLALQMLLVEMRRANQVCDQLRDEGQIATQRAPMKHGLIPGGPGVQATADVFDDFRQQLDAAGIKIDTLMPTPAPTEEATPEMTPEATASS